MVKLPNGIPVPVMIAHIVVGAGEPCEEGLKPSIIRDVLVILFPHTAVCEAYGRNIPLPDARTLPRLDYRGGFYEKLMEQPREQLKIAGIPVFFCDTSFTFLFDERAGRPRRRIGRHALAAIGRVISAALNAVAGIRRALEIGVVWEIRRRWPDALVLHDGPLVREMFLIYTGLAVEELARLERMPEKCFSFLKKVVGLVKRVFIVPESGLEAVFSGLSEGFFKIPIFRMLRPISGEESPEREARRAPFQGVLSCFCILRPKLATSIPLVISPSGGLVRIDVPIASILEEYHEDWMMPDFDVRSRLTSDGPAREALKRILSGILAERLPYPGTIDLHRMLVELAGTELIERVLRSRLLPKEVMRMLSREFL